VALLAGANARPDGHDLPRVRRRDGGRARARCPAPRPPGARKAGPWIPGDPRRSPPGIALFSSSITSSSYAVDAQPRAGPGRPPDPAGLAAMLVALARGRPRGPGARRGAPPRSHPCETMSARAMFTVTACSSDRRRPDRCSTIRTRGCRGRT
jgi:hypothetical protein